ncbi:hypothetical protein SmJEL517_g00542 [Synchytrium microbalum]|uniref:Serine aminopeptidase S33 domain-containing protein n=1 Tax=Synchytrium microbalum TaxID=1806994 RepID=A0A507CDB4_9FUNG|nr:uncharacterized protein SmJEL517_g00542 [Synchytrium microbalum]TPX37491.1 hypothetical protein SmJEL517_g00542 [Synchytrium microbalum]
MSKTETKHTILNRDGLKLIGFLESKNTGLNIDDGKGQKLVLINHGVYANKNWGFFRELAASLPYPSYRTDFRGEGESEGELGYGSYQEDVDDLEIIVAYLRERNWNVYGMIGHSRGGNISLFYAQRHPHSLRFVCTVSARFYFRDGFLRKHGGADGEDMKSLKEQGYFIMNMRARGAIRPFRISPVEWNKLMNSDDAVREARNLPKTLPVFLQHGAADETVLVSDIANFASLIPNASVKLILGGDHFFGNKAHASEAVKNIVEWIQYNETSLRVFWRTFGEERRLLKIEGVPNARDVGGYPCGPSKIVRWGRIFRTGSVHEVTETGTKTLLALGVKTIFDLRSIPEVQNNGVADLSSLGITRVQCPVFEMEDYSPEALAIRWGQYSKGPDGFSQVYTMMSSKGATAYRQYYRHLLEKDTPCIIHCSAGKDRVGTGIALLLSFLGVDDDIVARDYAMSAVIEGRDRDENVLKDFMVRYKAQTGTEIDMQGASNMLGTNPASMLGALKGIRAKYGSLQQYFVNEIGFTKAECDKLREKLLVAPPEMPASFRALI